MATASTKGVRYVAASSHVFRDRIRSRGSALSGSISYKDKGLVKQAHPQQRVQPKDTAIGRGARRHYFAYSILISTLRILHELYYASSQFCKLDVYQQFIVHMYSYHSREERCTKEIARAPKDPETAIAVADRFRSIVSDAFHLNTTSSTLLIYVKPFDLSFAKHHTSSGWCAPNVNARSRKPPSLPRASSAKLTSTTAPQRARRQNRPLAQAQRLSELRA